MNGIVNINNTIGILMKSQLQSHVWHMNTNGYAQHIALEEFYNGIVEHIDALAEISRSYDPEFMVGGFKIEISDSAEIGFIDYFESLRGAISSFCDMCTEEDIKDVFIQITKLISSTIYKLKLM